MKKKTVESRKRGLEGLKAQRVAELQMIAGAIQFCDDLLRDWDLEDENLMENQKAASPIDPPDTVLNSEGVRMPFDDPSFDNAPDETH
jgi:hypothetical protein